MAINKVTFNSVDFWEDLGAALSAPVAYPIPAEVKEQVKVKGMNGSLTEATGYFNNLEIELNFKVLIGRGSDLETKTFNTLKRKINKLFNGIQNNRLMFSDVPDRYYKVNSCGVGSVTKTSDYEAEFSATFICDPFLYNPKEQPVTTQGTFSYNGDIPNQPIIKLEATGTGEATVNCNGKTLTFTVEDAGKIEINNNPYSTVTVNGTPIVSEGTPPILTPGSNNLTISTAFGWRGGLTLIKNERYLG